MRRSNVLDETSPILTKADAKRRFAAALQRMVNLHGKGTVCDYMDVSPNTVNNAMAQTTLPELDTALNALRLDPTAFDELLQPFGLRAVPMNAEQAEDLDLADALGQIAAALAKSRSPNSPGGVARVHTETLGMAALVRHSLPKLTALLHEADKLRSVA